ncbi:hypothetical protein LXL04_005339 [Taraxacum kok-saghyz]
MKDVKNREELTGKKSVADQRTLKDVVKSRKVPSEKKPEKKKKKKNVDLKNPLALWTAPQRLDLSLNVHIYHRRHTTDKRMPPGKTSPYFPMLNFIEETDHLLVKCDFAKEVFSWIFKWCNVACPNFDKVADVFYFAAKWGNCPKKRKILLAIINEGFWCIWKSRNDKIFASFSSQSGGYYYNNDFWLRQI